jgi:glycosyltransferase involved in cell wall biosynthesis
LPNLDANLPGTTGVPNTKASFRQFNPERWGLVAFNDHTGLGRQAVDLRKILGLGVHFVKPSERLADVGRLDSGQYALKDLCNEDLRGLLAPLEGLIFLESPFTEVRVLNIAKSLGKPCVLQPNWEWFPIFKRKAWSKFDLFACPTHYTQKWLQFAGARPTAIVPPALDLSQLPQRHIEGKPSVFVHNAGIVDDNDRKGTRVTLEAFLQSGIDGSLIVRMQKSPPRFVEKLAKDPRIDLRVGDLHSHRDLYAVGDVIIQPSSLEGIGFQIIEALASGMPVITTNYPPMNEWVQADAFLARPNRWFKFARRPRLSLLHTHFKTVPVSELAKIIRNVSKLDVKPFSMMANSLRRDLFATGVVNAAWETAICRHLPPR